jgi:acetolactate synthase I/II/III large subunit
MKVADYIARHLAAEGVGHVFELVGGMTTHMIDSIDRLGATRIVTVRHEQAASFAADAYGRLAGVPGVALATSGPGATNLLTGIGGCHFDSSPAVFLTGQVNRDEQKGNRAIRQLGFQETDIVAMAAPITKAAWRVDDPQEIPALLTRAFDLARSGRPGPVLVDIPMDVQRAEVGNEPQQSHERTQPADVAESAVHRMLELINGADRPLILAGGGIRASGATAAFRALIRRLRVPVVHSLMAVDVLPYDNPNRVGMIGTYGNRWANMAIARSDLLVVLGSRLDVRQTGALTEEFRKGRTIVHVDCEPGEINNRVQGCEAIVAHLRPFLNAAAEIARTLNAIRRDAWSAEIASLRREWPDTQELRGIHGINPNIFLHNLAAKSGLASAYTVDVGQHQMWAAQSLELGAEQRFLTSGGMGAMGFALPAAIGAAFSSPGRPVVMIAGDGGFQLNLQELQTVVHHRLPIKMIVINNGCHGMVRQFQQSYFESRYCSTSWGYSAPDFARVAEAYGIRSLTIDEPDEIDAGLAVAWESTDEPFMLQVMIDGLANVYPKLAFGRPITEMEPFAAPLGVEAT